ncbi:MAG: hypothetical protein WC868_07085 [Bacteroidales bacterium]
MKKEPNKNLTFNIVSIKETNFYFNEKSNISFEGLPLRLKVKFEDDVEKDHFIITSGIDYYYKKERVLSISIANCFEIKNLKIFLINNKKEKEFDLPNELINYLTSISFHHTRAILATKVLNTKFEKYLFPIFSKKIIDNLLRINIK